MSRLSREARETIKWYWAGDSRLTIAEYVRHHSPDGVWYGDTCGCTDDRCRGFHHDPDDDCGCLPVLLDMYAEPLAVRTP